MNYVGGFRKEEIDGKPFHIFNFLPQIPSPSSGETSIDSVGHDLAPLFQCPSFRIREGKQWKNDLDDCNDFVPVDVYPQFFNKRISDNPCKLPLVPLLWCNNKRSYQEFFCGVCDHSTPSTDYFFCVTCDQMFHKECIESPLEIKHPSYPFLSLNLYYPPNLKYDTLRCFCCQERIYQMLYYCPTYELVMLPICAIKPIPIVIDHLKRHSHPLTFFPKQNSLVCDVCGLINEHFPTYVCALCVFVVHQDCIYSPYVIRISRHHHRISFTSSLPSGRWSCGVCRRKVDNDCGAYSCDQCDNYFIHTRCALRRDLWDGKELEGVAEEAEIVVEPFQRIVDGIILHFSHDHRLKLEMSKFYDEDKSCQTCLLPIYEGSYYSCIAHCDFILHEVCANAPLKKQHPLHANSLTLEVNFDKYNNCEGYFRCDACKRESCGFVYADGYHLKLDLRCASVSEPFEYEGHEHPLFLALKPEEERSAICKICQEEGDENNYCRKLNCIECNFIICFACATLPYKARYKHDKHFLTFHEKEEANDDLGWCDICESKIVFSRKGGFYSCDDYCSTTVHVDCLFGEDMYMKHGQAIIIRNNERVHILRNKTMSRPLCHGTEHRCEGKVVFEMDYMTFCSQSCLYQFRE
ncbi:hypothetical protein AALP_AA6G338200 [Arabis alpina]|uniref:Zinc finger PHD-type domain-containing protein n=1 Tax=Arabis alpina TaxID=50452 RepID=A0A087GTF7_ARAAL|nr:hypothetical protein AALP_AA6G338200 [Arabis alpina]